MLRVCWRLTRAIAQEESKLEELREMALQITAQITGLPPNKSNGSKIERITLSITESERRISALKGIRAECAIEMTERITALIGGRARAVLLMRYALCKSFRDIGIELGYSERRVYQLHKLGMQKISVAFQ